jgi:hypothetical protein
MFFFISGRRIEDGITIQTPTAPTPAPTYPALPVAQRCLPGPVEVSWDINRRLERDQTWSDENDSSPSFLIPSTPHSRCSTAAGTPTGTLNRAAATYTHEALPHRQVTARRPLLPFTVHDYNNSQSSAEEF